MYSFYRVSEQDRPTKSVIVVVRHEWKFNAMMTMLLILITLDLIFISPSDQMQLGVRSNLRFSSCNTSDRQVACALDAPDKIVKLDPNRFGSVCVPTSAQCAWECRLDPRCLEFNSRSNNQTCELFYGTPITYASVKDCSHFQVKITQELF